MNKLRCVIFDVDGTLAQTNKLIFDTFNHIAQKYLHKTFSEPEIIALFGPPEEVCIEKMLGKEIAAAACEDYYAYYAEQHASLAPLYPGVVEMLEHLKKRGMILAVFTGKGIRTTTITLELSGILKHFDMLVTGSDVVNHKPSSEGISKIMEKYDLSNEEVLMVGDSVADMKAAHSVGVKTAAVVWDSYMKPQVLALQPDLVFYSAEELLIWIKDTFPL
ncbi:MAG: HAD-IA family hydrolase [Bacteroidota bacterium]